MVETRSTDVTCAGSDSIVVVYTHRHSCDCCKKELWIEMEVETSFILLSEAEFIKEKAHLEFSLDGKSKAVSQFELCTTCSENLSNEIKHFMKTITRKYKGEY